MQQKPCIVGKVLKSWLLLSEQGADEPWQARTVCQAVPTHDHQARV